MHNVQNLEVQKKHYFEVLINRLTFDFSCEVAVNQANNQLLTCQGSQQTMTGKLTTQQLMFKATK